MRVLASVFLAALLSNAAGLQDDFDDEGSSETKGDLSAQLSRFQASQAEQGGGEDVFNPPPIASEWYTVTIADVSVGYMHTTVDTPDDGSRVSTMEIMDVQVSRGTDTSRMAFETVFHEVPLDPKDPLALSEKAALLGGVQVMAYDQRFANSEVSMNVSFQEDSVTLKSFNGETEHLSAVDLPEVPWLGRMRARLEFTKQCRQGKTEIVVQTMRPELGPKVREARLSRDRWR